MSLDGPGPGRNGLVERGRLGVDVLRLPVRMRGIDIARAVDLSLDADTLRLVGIEVQCGDEVRRFLPCAAATIGGGEVSIDSALLLVDSADAAFYRGRTRSLRSLRGSAVERSARPVGTLADLVFRPDHSVAEVVVDAEDGRRRLPFDESLTIRPGAAASAA